MDLDDSEGRQLSFSLDFQLSTSGLEYLSLPTSTSSVFESLSGHASWESTSTVTPEAASITHRHGWIPLKPSGDSIPIQPSGDSIPFKPSGDSIPFKPSGESSTTLGYASGIIQMCGTSIGTASAISGFCSPNTIGNTTRWTLPNGPMTIAPKATSASILSLELPGQTIVSHTTDCHTRIRASLIFLRGGLESLQVPSRRQSQLQTICQGRNRPLSWDTIRMPYLYI